MSEEQYPLIQLDNGVKINFREDAVAIVVPGRTDYYSNIYWFKYEEISSILNALSDKIEKPQSVKNLLW